MAKRRKIPPRPREAPAPKPKAEKPAFSSPFKDLKKLLGERPKPKSADRKPIERAKAVATAVTPVVVAEPVPVLDDAALFHQAVDGVRRLGDQRPVRVVPKPEVTLEIISEDAEVLAQLSDLVSGVGTFELTETEEYTEGTRLGLDPRLVTRLRRGEFAVQAHIDLHGMIQADAKLALEEFIVGSVRKGLRTVLVVHGRGLRSPGGIRTGTWAGTCWRLQPRGRPTAARVRCTCCSGAIAVARGSTSCKGPSAATDWRAAHERPLHRNSGFFVGAVRERPSLISKRKRGRFNQPRLRVFTFHCKERTTRSNLALQDE